MVSLDWMKVSSLDFLDGSGQLNEGCLRLVDVSADGICIADVMMMLPALLPVLDDEVVDVVLLLYHDEEVVEDDDC